MAVILETSIGDITVDLYTEERPRCCLNFLKLCRTKFYNFCLFHSVQRNLVAQTGDPTGSGKGGESIFRKLYGDQAQYFEMESKPRIKHKKKGAISMVNNGSDMHGSQFFLTMGEELDYLDGVHTVFGEVSEGFDVLEKLNEVIVDQDNRPYRDVRIFHTVILDDPFDDPPGLAEHIPDRSPEPTKEQLESDRIGVDEDVNEMEGKTSEEIEEKLKEKEAKANAQILELVGDIPDVEAAPPENVLFVCKLNPVTTAEDLEIIFSRFGKINSCEVIKDQKTGESLQYAFIEFDKPEECENAYFKMDNVLIDDRRIHVDFSQSVSKLQGNKWARTQDEERPKFRIKNLDWKDTKYDYVFSSDDDSNAKSSKHHKKKKKKHKKQRDTDDSEAEKPEKLKKSHRERSSSPNHDRRRRSRSRSPKRRRDRRREDEDHRGRNRDDRRRRSRERDRQDDRLRDRSRERHHRR